MIESPAALWRSAMAYMTGQPAEQAFAVASLEAGWPREAAPSAADLEAVLRTVCGETGSFDDPDTARRLVNLTYALAAMLPLEPDAVRLTWPAHAGPLLARLYPDRSALEPLLAVLDQLEGLRRSCDAFPAGSFQLVKAEADLLHFTRTGPTELVNVICNRGGHMLVAAIGEKSTAVNAFGFTITVEEHGHNRDHSYYNVK